MLPPHTPPALRAILSDIAHTCPDLEPREVLEALAAQAGVDLEVITPGQLWRVALEWVFGSRRDF